MGTELCGDITFLWTGNFCKPNKKVAKSTQAKIQAKSLTNIQIEKWCGTEMITGVRVSSVYETTLEY